MGPETDSRILPTKHIRPDRSLLGIGADLLAGLAKPRTVSGLWDHLRLRRTASNSSAVDYRRFVLALDLLHMLGAIDFERGVIHRASP